MKEAPDSTELVSTRLTQIFESSCCMILHAVKILLVKIKGHSQVYGHSLSTGEFRDTGPGSPDYGIFTGILATTSFFSSNGILRIWACVLCVLCVGDLFPAIE